MNSLQEFYDILDLSDFDKSKEGEIRDILKQLSNHLFETKKEDAKISELEREAFSIQKSFDYKNEPENGKIGGLSWQLSGTQTLENGSVVPFYWPNVSAYTIDEFKYFEERFRNCMNQYAKAEYGLLVYFGKMTEFSKHRTFKKQLFQNLFDLAKRYFEEVSSLENPKGYTLYFFDAVEKALKIAIEARLEDELQQIVNYILDTLNDWEVRKPGTLRVVSDLAGIILKDFNAFKKTNSDFDKVIDRCLEAAEFLKINDKWGSISLLTICIGLQKKLEKSTDVPLKKKAILYEELADEADKAGNNSAVSLIEDSIRLFKKLKSKSDLDRLQQKYANLRGKFKLGKFSQKIGSEATDDLLRRIKESVTMSNEYEIIGLLIRSPWYPSLEMTRQMALDSASKSVFLSLIPTVVLDKFGNTIERFTSEAEKIEHNFLTTYGFNFQIGTQTLVRFFMEAFHAKKLSFESILSHLESTWINEEIERIYYGQEVKIKPIDTLKPPIKYFFDEMEKYRVDNTYNPDFVTVIDSLTLKIEGLIRYFVERLGIPTFKFKDSIAMEKLLDDLLADLAHIPEGSPNQKTNFDEDDRFLIKYVMTSKSGYNLRNKVAHSLLDADEYSLGFVIVLLCIILKLTKYKFIRRD
ncbi:DUF4209 domain-containing protein [Cecembia rubra]|uniref:Uncharacterized protein DUF4209 n=1 Tax=Cecembia rubra TaxID=1485585 RepID=A0A2P8ED10_9BACT|nr:DUF4209 domain-containing protein [Cecembia rubra]PSL07348.1 uncharacterized protein DUF4209 [Cecembia rubra]